MQKHWKMTLILITLIAVAFSGCSGPSESVTATPTAAAATPVPSSAASTEPAGTATPAPSPSAGPMTASSIFDMNSFNWFEYKYTVVADGKTSYMTLRVDYNDDTYNGVPAKRFKMDMVMEQDTSMYFDVYTDRADESVLGGRVKMTIAGQTIIDEDIKPDQGENYAKQNPAFSYGSESDEQLIPGEMETITVPAGTYVCTKYTIDSEKGKEYIWMAPGVPVPIKVVSESPEGTNTGELVGWG